MVDLLLPVLNLDDPGLITQPASGAQFGHAAFHILAIHHQAFPRGANDKALPPVQQGFQQFLSITASVHRPDAAPVRVRSDQIDAGQHLRIFAAELLSLGRIELLLERYDFTAVHLP
jgi:hypothetical protein